MSDERAKILFIVKERYHYGSPTKSYGLFNSCDFVARSLRENRISADVIQVIDNNYIDAAIAQYKPTHCFIEALWVVPEKFEVLASLHPKVEWIVRLHSMIPFLSNEGMAFEWLNKYMTLRKKGIKIAISCNNIKLYQYLKRIYRFVSYSPNIYNPNNADSNIAFDYSGKDYMNIGCFGALRPLKNTVQQAILAINFANELEKKLNFHVNVSEHEHSTAIPILKNLREIFSQTKHNLIEHPWYEHKDFLQLVKAMDFGMQVSFSETFNITAADFVHCQIPIVTSKEIEFVHDCCRSDVHDDKKIMKAMNNAYYGNFYDGRVFDPNFKVTLENTALLESHNKKALHDWYKLLDF